MEEITRSRVAMELAAAAAALYALGTVFAVIAYAVLSPSSLGTFTDLGHASDWLHFVGALVLLLAVGSVARDMMARQLMTALFEVGTITVGALLVAIGALVGAASSSSQSTADVLGAVGIGLWGLVAVARAARSANPEDPSAQVAPLWAAAGFGFVLLAVGSGFTIDPTDKGTGIASGIIQAVGAAIVAGVLSSARLRRLLQGKPLATVINAFGVLTVFFVGAAVVAAVVFSTIPSLNGLRIGLAIVSAVEAVGVVLFGLAAWTRYLEIPMAPTIPPPPGPSPSV